MMMRAHGADLCYTMMLNAGHFLALDPTLRQCFFQTCQADRSAAPICCTPSTESADVPTGQVSAN